MTSAQSESITPGLKEKASLRRASALLHFLRPLEPFFSNPAVTEICINKPGQVVTQANMRWEFHELPQLDFAYCDQLVRLMATFSDQQIDEKSPMLSATLPTGHRCRIVRPPAVLPNTISFTIRQPSSEDISLDMYEKAGAFDQVTDPREGLSQDETELLALKKAGRYREFIEKAVATKQNMIISGATGSGKTTFAKAILALVPRDERLISIENVDELQLRRTHENSVAMFYSSGGQGLSGATPQSLMESSLRQKPDRVFLSELITGNEAFYFMDTVSSGHPGSFTTMHANSTRLCIERLISLIRRSDDGRTMSTDDIRKMIHMCIDVFIQFKVVDNRRVVTEIYYDPEFKKSLMG
jgi:type IV secretion system protein VirB11